MVKIAKETFEAAGYKVLTANDGTEARAIYMEKHFASWRNYSYILNAKNSWGSRL